MQARMMATALTLEAFLVLFGLLAAYPTLSEEYPGNVVIGVALGLVAVLLLTAGVVRKSWGRVMAWVCQALLLATGIVFPVMWAVAPFFVALFWWLAGIGRKIDRSRDLAEQRETARR